ncbi:MAG: DUF4291 domain-containing protein [Bacteroidia bacterium]|nr:DUF4291 domain-containing protein [Bacteroidia bacterium]
MDLIYEKYVLQEATWPQSGKHILASFTDQEIVVYQAFNKQIGRYAVENQHFGGSHYSFARMSWIKPNFLWMMYRAGWATKKDQECILAISLKIEGFLTLLSLAVPSSYNDVNYPSQQAWQDALKSSEVRLQWDPDHDAYGNKETRKAIQLGLRGQILQDFSAKWITRIEDISPWVEVQREKIRENGLDELRVPAERVFHVTDPAIVRNLHLSPPPNIQS